MLILIFLQINLFYKSLGELGDVKVAGAASDHISICKIMQRFYRHYTLFKHYKLWV